jgi:putative flippase GtrA
LFFPFTILEAPTQIGGNLLLGKENSHIVISLIISIIAASKGNFLLNKRWTLENTRELTKVQDQSIYNRASAA